MITPDPLGRIQEKAARAALRWAFVSVACSVGALLAYGGLLWESTRPWVLPAVTWLYWGCLRANNRRADCRIAVYRAKAVSWRRYGASQERALTQMIAVNAKLLRNRMVDGEIHRAEDA